MPLRSLKLSIFVPIILPGREKKIRRGTGEISPPAHQAIQNVFERELHGGLTGRSGASTSPGQLGSRAIGIGQELVSQEVEVWRKVEVLRYDSLPPDPYPPDPPSSHGGRTTLKRESSP